MLDIAAIRECFPCLTTPVNGKRLAWLDTASTALKPAAVTSAVCQYYQQTPANVHRGVHALSQSATALFEASRARVQSFINASSAREIVFTSGTTEGINIVALACGHKWFQPEDEILITELEHHANIVPWQMLRDRLGIKLIVAPITTNGDLDLAAFANLLNSRTRLVAITAVSNAIGTKLPLDQIIPLSHAVGAKVLIDAAQAAACLPLDVQALDCDFMVFSGHKLFGPTGIGVLYAKESHLESLPPVKGGGDMIRTVTFEKTRYNDLPYKFEAGTANIAGAIGLGKAIEFIRSIGFDDIIRHEASLVTETIQQLNQIDGISIIGHPTERHNIVSFVMNDIHPHDAGTLLDEDGVAVRVGHHCAQPLLTRLGVVATIRASFSIYNTSEDIDQLVSSLNRIIRIFA